MDIGQAFLLAVIQGVTEFLPVSSSAHLVIAPVLLGHTVQSVLFDSVVHASTLLAVVLYFFRDLRNLVIGCLSGSPKHLIYAQTLVLGTLPVVVVGWFAYPFFDSLRSVSFVAVALIISGSLLFLVDCLARKGVIGLMSERWRGLSIGLFQMLALIPGVSRSGITITGGRLFGLSRTEAARFSFLLSIPVIAGALIVTVLRDPSGAAISFTPLALAALTAGTVALAVIHLFLRMIERVGFFPFFAYQVLLGGVLLVFV